jgi:uncharacterized protein (TIGR00251 family)
MRPSPLPTDPAAPGVAADAGAVPLVRTSDGLRLRVHVTPRAGAERIGGIIPGPRGPRLQVSVSAPPHEGKANTAVIKLLARSWRLPKTTFAVVTGAAGRDKVIAIHGDADVLVARLASELAGIGRKRR